MKNCEPFVSLPLLAIDSRYSLLCLTAKLSSREKKKNQVFNAILRQLPSTSYLCKHSEWRITFKKASIYGLASSSITCDNIGKLKHDQSINARDFLEKYLLTVG